MKRSDFLKAGGAIMVCTCGSSVLYGCKAITGNSDTPLLPDNSYTIKQNNIILDTNKIPELAQIGGSVKLQLSDRDLKIIVAKTGENIFVALPDRCTHGDRELEYYHDKSIFRCVSFGHSRFDQNGNVVKGPAKVDLEVYKTSLNNDELSIEFV